MSDTTMFETTLSTLKSAAHEANDDLHVAAHEAGRKVRRIYNSVGEEISDTSDHVTSEIRKNPIRSSLIALGIGVVLGALLRK